MLMWTLKSTTVILATVMMNIVVDKSTDNANPLIFFPVNPVTNNGCLYLFCIKRQPIMVRPN